VAITSPPTSDLVGLGDQLPNGRQTQYAYSDDDADGSLASNDPMRHNLRVS